MTVSLFLPSAFALIALITIERPDSPPVSWSERIIVASGEGYRGPWRMNDSEWRHVDDPAVAISDDGVVAVAWGDQHRQDIFLQIYEADGKPRFPEPVNVSRNPGIFSWLPRIVITEGEINNVYVLWQEIIFSGGTHGGEIFFAMSTDGGRTFGRSMNLSNTTAGAGKGRLDRASWHNGSLDIALGRQGNIYAAWTEYEGPLRFSRSTDGGRSFSQPLHVFGDNRIPARGPSMVVDNDGNIFLAWTVGEDASANIHVARSTDGGLSFGASQIAFESKGHADAPHLAVDSKGTLHLVYAESASGPFQRYRIVYTRLQNNGSSFENPRDIVDGDLGLFESAHFPSLDVDGEDNVYLVWKLFPRYAGRPFGLGFTYSRDGGQTFASPTIVPGTDDPALGFLGSMNGLLMREIAVNPYGEFAIVNSTFKMNEFSHIWLIKGRLNPH